LDGVHSAPRPLWRPAVGGLTHIPPGLGPPILSRPCLGSGQSGSTRKPSPVQQHIIVTGAPLWLAGVPWAIVLARHCHSQPVVLTHHPSPLLPCHCLPRERTRLEMCSDVPQLVDSACARAPPPFPPRPARGRQCFVSSCIRAIRGRGYDPMRLLDASKPHVLVLLAQAPPGAHRHVVVIKVREQAGHAPICIASARRCHWRPGGAGRRDWGFVRALFHDSASRVPPLPYRPCVSPGPAPPSAPPLHDHRRTYCIPPHAQALDCTLAAHLEAALCELRALEGASAQPRSPHVVGLDAAFYCGRTLVRRPVCVGMCACVCALHRLGE
jgi:hypothetical protein